jgi:hypothetical protein
MRDDITEADSLDGDQGVVQRFEEVAVYRDDIHVHDAAEGDIDEE